MNRGAKKIKMLHKQKQQMNNFANGNQVEDQPDNTDEEDLRALKERLSNEYYDINYQNTRGMSGLKAPKNNNTRNNKISAHQELQFGKRFGSRHDKQDMKNIHRLRSIKTPAVRSVLFESASRENENFEHPVGGNHTLFSNRILMTVKRLLSMMC